MPTRADEPGDDLVATAGRSAGRTLTAKVGTFVTSGARRS